MAPAVLLRGGDRLFGLSPEFKVSVSTSLGANAERSAERWAEEGTVVLPAEIARWVNGAGIRAALAAPEPRLKDALAALGIAVVALPLSELRRAHAAIPRAPPAAQRDFLIELARCEAAMAISSPVEALISLAREEARLERALGRERSAASEFVTGNSPALLRHDELGQRFLTEFEEHHRAVSAELERSAGEVVPNLSELLGGRLAAQLVSSAGGIAPLARMSASRLQLLGARRRPSEGHGPRFGLLYRSPRLADLPTSRWAAYARSVAALSVIAARADGITHGRIGSALVARRDRRFDELRRRGR
ncbi:MAG: hypothetical protein L3K09_01455 [Thermoplasmata archaeon]|nr:hypothetical protein [Thermoplasmata archaeon]